MILKKLISSYSVNILTFVVCLIAFKASISLAAPQPTRAPPLTTAEEIKAVLSSCINTGKKLVVLSDFDGTLANIVPHPPDAAILPEAKTALTKLSKNKNVHVGIISGRLMKEVRERIQLNNIIYTGNHGLEIAYPPPKAPYAYQMAPNVQNDYNNMIRELTALKNSGRGCTIEDKTYSVTFHYRNVSSAAEKARYKYAAEQIIVKNRFIPKDALEAIEGRPPFKWDKDDTALLILKGLFGDNWRGKANIVFFGDDKADELVMAALKGYSKTFRVSSQPILTHADYMVETPRTVAMILTQLAKLYKC